MHCHPDHQELIDIYHFLKKQRLALFLNVALIYDGTRHLQSLLFLHPKVFSLLLNPKEVHQPMKFLYF
jgi:hypothetical protein